MIEEIEDHDPRNRIFIVMWDMHGLEAVVPVPDPADTTFALLQNKKPPEMPNLMHMKLRAQYNTQRHYEIYIITTTPGINKDDIVDMFENNPQAAADTVRRLGHCYYSDRLESNRVTIR